jgi:hypothetical protein
MSKPLGFSDEELDLLVVASRPIAYERRDAFVSAVSQELLNSGEERGPGSVARAIRRVQPRFVHQAIGRALGTRKYG